MVPVEEPPQAPATAPSPPTPDPPAIVPPPALDQRLRLLGYIVSARAILLLAVIGGFVLAVFAMTNQGVYSLLTLVAYSMIVILPLVYLEVRKHVVA